jgi:hypothetical protein
MEYAGGLIEKVLPIWIAAWAFQREYKLDRKLDRGMQMLPWAVAFAGFALDGAFTALAFLCWPNFAYRLMRLFRRDGNRGEQDA